MRRMTGASGWTLSRCLSSEQMGKGSLSSRSSKFKGRGMKEQGIFRKLQI